jgi:sirohydrochlorin ferrochelatase
VTTGLLLIAHGSRHPQANADLHHLAEALSQRGWPIVEPSFLDLASPDIEEGGQRCVTRGAQQVILVPYFLSAGVHVQRDLEAAREWLTQRFPEVTFALADPLGRHPLLVEVVLERIGEKIVDRGPFKDRGP